MTQGYVDYDRYNYCTICDIKYPKNVNRCTIDASHKLRSKRRNKSKYEKVTTRKPRGINIRTEIKMLLHNGL